jgi:hypothetical protein
MVIWLYVDFASSVTANLCERKGEDVSATKQEESGGRGGGGGGWTSRSVFSMRENFGTVGK